MSYRILPAWHQCSDSCTHGRAATRFEAQVLARTQTAPTAGALAGTALEADFSRLSGRAIDPSRRVLLRGATIISMDPKVGDLACGDLLIEGPSIAAIAPRIEADAITIDCDRRIVIPGFSDPHIHSWEGALSRLIPNNASSVAEDSGLPEPSPHRTRSYMFVAHRVFGPAYRPQDIYAGTLMTLLAAIDGGITTVCDNMHNARTPAHSDAAIFAMMDSGIRGVHAFGRPRFGEWDRQFPQDAYRLRKSFFSGDDQLLTMRFYMVGRDSMDELEQVVKARRELDLWITFDSGIGQKPVAELYGDGRFDGRETINHGNFVSLEKRRILAAHGAKVNVCPRIESQFRFGEIPYQDWLDVGVEPALSNDNPATYAISMFSEMQTLYAYQRARAHRERMQGADNPASLSTLRDILRSATLRGAENCALDHKVGSLTPGKQADIVVIDAGKPNLFPMNNAVGTVAQGASASSVDTVFIAGRLAKWQGKLVGIDFEQLARQVEASRAYLFDKVGWPLQATDFGD